MMRLLIVIFFSMILVSCKTEAPIKNQAVHEEQSPDPTHEQMESVKKGMTKQEVINLLGNHFFMREERMCYRARQDANFVTNFHVYLKNNIVTHVKTSSYMDGPEPME